MSLLYDFLYLGIDDIISELRELNNDVLTMHLNVFEEEEICCGAVRARASDEDRKGPFASSCKILLWLHATDKDLDWTGGWPWATGQNSC